MWIEPTKQIFMWKEIFGFITLLGTLVTLLPLTSLLLSTEILCTCCPTSSRTAMLPAKKDWWKLATTNMLIGGILYPLTTQYGGIGGKIETWFPWAKMEMANGVAAFFLANAVVAFILFIFWFREKKKEGLTLYDMGVTYGEEEEQDGLGHPRQDSLARRYPLHVDVPVLRPVPGYNWAGIPLRMALHAPVHRKPGGLLLHLPAFLPCCSS